MKNLFFLIGFVAISSMWSCKTTKDTVVISPPDVPEVPVVEDAPVMQGPVMSSDVTSSEGTVVVADEDVVLGTIAITEFVYYTIEMADGKEKFVEQVVAGDGVFFNENGEERLTITLDGTNKQIMCKQMMHPKLKTDVYVEIGDDSETRDH